MLVKYRALSLVAVLTLGLGIGLSTTVFSVVNGGLFKGLPFPDADRIVSLVATNPSQRQPRQSIGVQDLAVYLDAQKVFETIGAYGFTALNVSSEDRRPDRLRGGELTVAAFDALGVQPILGRGFRDGDDRPGAAPVMLVGHTLWRERFAGSPDVVGQTLRVNGVTRTIVGVMPERFAFPIRRSGLGAALDRPAGQAQGRGSEVPGDRPSQARRQRRAGQGADVHGGRAARAGLPADQPRHRRRRDAIHQDGARPRDLRAPVHHARGRHRRAAHRVRQRIEPARGPRVAAASRGGGAHGARRRAVIG